MALVVSLQEDEDIQNVYRNLKIFCETDPRAVNMPLTISSSLLPKHTLINVL